MVSKKISHGRLFLMQEFALRRAPKLVGGESCPVLEWLNAHNQLCLPIDSLPSSGMTVKSPSRTRQTSSSLYVHGKVLGPHPHLPQERHPSSAIVSSSADLIAFIPAPFSTTALATTIPLFRRDLATTRLTDLRGDNETRE